jgi:hypothetical protein
MHAVPFKCNIPNKLFQYVKTRAMYKCNREIIIKYILPFFIILLFFFFSLQGYGNFSNQAFNLASTTSGPELYTSTEQGCQKLLFFRCTHSTTQQTPFIPEFNLFVNKTRAKSKVSPRLVQSPSC